MTISSTSSNHHDLLRLRTADNHIVTVEPALLISRSGLIASLLEHATSTPSHEIHLSQVTEPILRRIIEYCRYHREDPPWNDALHTSDAMVGAPALSAVLEQQNTGLDSAMTHVSVVKAKENEAWDREFCRGMDHGTLVEMIKAANFMEVMGLLDVLCRVVADMLRGKTVEEMREMFGIENDWGEGEEALVREENAWCEDEEE